MKRLFTLFLVLIIGGLLYANGVAEDSTGNIELTVVGVGATGTSYQSAYDKVREMYPGVTIQTIESDVATGEDITMAALLAAGDPPDVYVDFVGRAGKYVTPAFALPMDVDESVWVPGILDQYKRNGKLYALPMHVPGIAMVVNTTLCEQVGYDLPDGLTWTIDDFVDFAEAIKQNGPDGVYATGLFAANPSADYLWVNWFGSFGVKEFFSNDYTVSNADSDAFLHTWMFFDALMKRGYIHPNSAMWGAAPDFLQGIGTGTMGAYGAYIGWADGMQGSYNKDGEHYEWTVKSYPSLDGSVVGTIGGGHIAVPHKTDYAFKAQIITDLVLAMTGRDVQYGNTRKAGIPTRLDVPVSTDFNKGEDVVYEIFTKAGLIDVGFPNSWYYETRSIGPQVLQLLLKGEITPKEAQAMYFEKVTAVIGK